MLWDVATSYQPKKNVESTLKCLLGKVLLMNFGSTLNNLLKHCIFANFLLMEGYVLVALGKELHIAPFLEHFKTDILKRCY